MPAGAPSAGTGCRSSLFALGANPSRVEEDDGVAIDERYAMKLAVSPAASAGTGKARLRSFFHPRLWGRQLDLGSIGLGLLIFWFAAVHLRLWIAQPGVFVGAGQVALEILQGVLLFIRRPDTLPPRAARVWIATTVGSWGFLLARP